MSSFRVTLRTSGLAALSKEFQEVVSLFSPLHIFPWQIEFRSAQK
ncbi:MAG: hypothetical protein ABFS09_11190 [Thermodesulfobacteriota bacterium]